VVRLHSSGGVVSRTGAVRKQARMQRVKEYFYGVRGDLSPHSQTVRLDDLRIYRIGGGPRAPTSALPIGVAPLFARASIFLPLQQSKDAIGIFDIADILSKEYFATHSKNLTQKPPNGETYIDVSCVITRFYTNSLRTGVIPHKVMLRAGASSVADPLRITPVSASLDLVHAMLAVSHAVTPDQLLSVNVAGFVLITDVDIVHRTITYLAPCPGPLPGKYLIAGSFKVFIE